MLYFVQVNKLHRFPVSKHCNCMYRNETLLDTIPHGVEQCIYCMNYWPDDKS